ncbi:MAG: hypothetical protein HZA50_06495 [Planctomycetes bacterium]|nr:hypothetical protein [Planctomycetota bacterium]
MIPPSKDEDMSLLGRLVNRDRQAGRADPQPPAGRDEGRLNREKDLSNAIDAIRLLVEADPPEGLAEATMDRIAGARGAQAAMTRRELSGRPRPTLSLTELAAAVVAALLLLAIIIPSVQTANRRSLRNACLGRMGQIGSGLLAYSIDNSDMLPSGSPDTVRWLPQDGRPAGSNSSGLFKLITGGYVPSPSVFQCPAVGGDGTAPRPDMADFQSPRQISYSYQHAMGRPGICTHSNALGGMTDRMAILADSSPVFAGGYFKPEKVRSARSENHDGQGQNILYLDWHVAWSESPEAGVRNNNIYLAEGVTEYRGCEKPASDYDSFLLPDFVPAAGKK